MMIQRKHIRDPLTGNLNQPFEVLSFSELPFKELLKQCLAWWYPCSFEWPGYLWGFQRVWSRKETIWLLNNLFVTLLGRKSTKRGWCEFIHQKKSNRKISQMEMFSLPLSNSSKFLRKEAHHNYIWVTCILWKIKQHKKNWLKISP